VSDILPPVNSLVAERIKRGSYIPIAWCLAENMTRVSEAESWDEVKKRLRHVNEDLTWDEWVSGFSCYMSIVGKLAPALLHNMVAHLAAIARFREFNRDAWQEYDECKRRGHSFGEDVWVREKGAAADADYVRLINTRPAGGQERRGYGGGASRTGSKPPGGANGGDSRGWRDRPPPVEQQRKEFCMLWNSDSTCWWKPCERKHRCQICNGQHRSIHHDTASGGRSDRKRQGGRSASPGDNGKQRRNRDDSDSSQEERRPAKGHQQRVRKGPAQTRNPGGNRQDHRQVLPSPAAVTPVKADRLSRQAANFPDKKVLFYVLRGLQWGFSLCCHPGSLESAKRHSPSAYSNREVVENYLKEETAAGSMAGPFDAAPWTDLHLNRVSLKPKHEVIDLSLPANNQYRLIVDLSYPEGKAVNSFIADADASVSYVSLDTVFDRLVELGPGSLLFKLDIERAYRIIPVREEDRRLLGIKFQERFYVDLTLPFGGRSCAKIFNTAADVFCHALMNACSTAELLHYLDDFLGIIRAECEREGREDFNRVVALAEWLGIPLSAKKLAAPATSTIFLGFTIDTVSMTVSLPTEKRERYRAAVGTALDFRKISKQALLSLTGKLMHVSQVLSPGRPFIRRLINRAHTVRSNSFLVSLGPGEREDLEWWERILAAWVGAKLITFREWRRPANFFARSDASGRHGFGIVSGKEWCHGVWTEEEKDLNIAVLELVPLVLAAHMWGRRWQRQRVLFETDNMAVVHCASSWLPRDDHLTKLFRILATKAIEFNFDLKVVHLPGVDNVDADDLSRGKIEAFRTRNPDAHSSPTEVPLRLVRDLCKLEG
jgi:hypothetical protein